VTDLPGESVGHRAARLAPRGAHRQRPDTQVIERPGWYQVVTPSDPSGALNEVLWSDLPDGPDDPVDERIASVIHGYGRLGVAFKWCVWPWSRPADLAERLTAHRLTSWSARGMTIDTGAPFTPGDTVVTEVSDEVGDFAAVWSEGWGEPLDSARADAERMADDPRQHLFVAWCDGEPAGVATTLDQPDAGYLQGAVVLPRFRGRGAYRSLIAARLRQLAARGVTLATTHAREATSAPILARLGFRTEFRYQVFRGTP